MAQSLVTQVEKGSDKDKKKGSFFQRLCSCFSTSEDHVPNVPKANNSNFNSTASLSGKRCLLGPQADVHKGRHCLVLDLDETLVHSSFQPTAVFDFQIQVQIEGMCHDVYVAKRPYVDEFLERMAKCYEVVIFTASLAKYANPVLDNLDPNQTICARLFRESCVPHGSQFVKDMDILGRDITRACIVDNSPSSYARQPENGIPIVSWFDDKSDRCLVELADALEKIADCDNMIETLRACKMNGE
jgi:RNA polymerase II subunit A small phosphatase-like protein